MVWINQFLKLNGEWHSSHRMPKNATLDQRIEWPIEHKKNCGSRGVPRTIKKEVDKRKETGNRKSPTYSN
jgi:hypothetical protein